MEEVLNINQEKPQKKARYIKVDVLNEIGEVVEGRLTERNEVLIQLYLFDDDHRGNQTQSYCTAYNLNPTIKKQYDTARSCSSQAFSKPEIIARIRYLIRKSALDVTDILSNLRFLMDQKSNKVVSLGASKVLLNQYNLIQGIEKSKAGKTKKGKIVSKVVVKEIPGRSEDISD